jgi:hypothetical protein
MKIFGEITKLPPETNFKERNTVTNVTTSIIWLKSLSEEKKHVYFYVLKLFLKKIIIFYFLIILNYFNVMISKTNYKNKKILF